MFLHIGEDQMVNTKDIIMVLDYTKLKKTDTLKNFINKLNQKGRFAPEKIDEKNCKSLVVTEKKTYLSPIATLTLLKRIKHKN